jgi:hypothetical protein
MAKQEIVPKSIWRNRILAEKPFANQQVVDEAAERLYPQGKNEFVVIGVDEAYQVLYREVGSTGDSTSIAAAQFLRDFELIH